MFLPVNISNKLCSLVDTRPLDNRKYCACGTYVEGEGP